MFSNPPMNANEHGWRGGGSWKFTVGRNTFSVTLRLCDKKLCFFLRSSRTVFWGPQTTRRTQACALVPASYRKQIRVYWRSFADCFFESANEHRWRGGGSWKFTVGRKTFSVTPRLCDKKLRVFCVLRGLCLLEVTNNAKDASLCAGTCQLPRTNSRQFVFICGL